MQFLKILIFNSCNPELQLKDVEIAVKNKPIDLFFQLRGGFKLVPTLVIEF